MTSVYLTSAKYILIILMAFYTYTSFYVIRNIPEKLIDKACRLQVVMIFLINIIAYSILYLNLENDTIILFCGIQLIYYILTIGLTNILYDKQINKPVLNNMCLMLTVGLIILTRLNYSKAIKQFIILIAATILYLIVPKFIIKFRKLKEWSYLYAIVGIVLLSVVLVAGSISYGAKLSLTIFGISFQFSEVVKLLYVFFISSMLKKKVTPKIFFISAALAGLHVIILVLSRDLGSALIFFLIYLSLIYVATGKLYLFVSGLIAGSSAACIAYKLFSHVRIRVLAYTDPFSVIDNEGYQITQSLFAIGTGGLLGMGLCNGLPNKVPVVDQDFIISAIAEELGGFFAISLMLLCMCTFLSFVKIASEQPDSFYKLIAFGLSISYAVQTILTIGGAIKFIPSTGVTLPLVSYGGSSLFCTMLIFGIFQGINGLRKRV